MRKYLHYSVVFSIAVFMWLVTLTGFLGFMRFFMKSSALEDIFASGRRHGFDVGPSELNNVHHQELAHEPQMKREGSKLLTKFPSNPMGPQALSSATTVSYVTNTSVAPTMSTSVDCVDCSSSSLTAVASTPKVKSLVSRIVVVNGAVAPVADGVDSSSGNSPDSFFSILSPALHSIPPPKSEIVTLVSTITLLNTTTTTCLVTQTWHSTHWSTTTETWYSTCFEFTTAQISFVAAMTVTVTVPPFHECQVSSDICSKCRPTATSSCTCMESKTPCEKCMPTPTTAPQHMGGCSCKSCNSVPQMTTVTLTKDMENPVTKDTVPPASLMSFVSITAMPSISAAASSSVSTSSSAGPSSADGSSSIIASSSAALSSSERVATSESAPSSAAAPSFEGTPRPEAVPTSTATLNSAAASSSAPASNSVDDLNSAAVSSSAMASSSEVFLTLPTVSSIILPSSLPTTFKVNSLHGAPPLQPAHPSSAPVVSTTIGSITGGLSLVVPSLAGPLSNVISSPGPSTTFVSEIGSSPATSISGEITCVAGMIPQLDVDGNSLCIVQPGVSKAIGDVTSSVVNILPSAVTSRVTCAIGTLPKVDIHGLVDCVVPELVSGVVGDVSSLIGVTQTLDEAQSITRVASPAINNIISGITPTLTSVVVPSLKNVAASVIGGVFALPQGINSNLGGLHHNQATGNTQNTIAAATRGVGGSDTPQAVNSGFPLITAPLGGIGEAEAVEITTSPAPVDKASDVPPLGPQNPTIMTSVDGAVTQIIQPLEATSTSILLISSTLKGIPSAASLSLITAPPTSISLRNRVVAPIKRHTTLLKRIVQVTSTVTVFIPRLDVSSSIMTTTTLLRGPFQ